MKRIAKNAKSFTTTLCLAISIALVTFSMVSMFAISLSKTSDLQKEGLARRLDDFGQNEEKSASWNLFNKKAPKKYVSKIKIPKLKKNVQNIAISKPISNDNDSQSAFKDLSELNLNLVEVYNPKRYKKPLTSDLFEGSLHMLNGEIASIEISLPNGEEISINYSTLLGNTFVYDYEGMEYRAAIFKASAKDQNTFVVSLNGGPFDQTRLKFTDKEIVQDEQEIAIQDEASKAIQRELAAQDEREELADNAELQELPELQDDRIENQDTNNFDITEEELSQKIEDRGFNFAA